MKSTQVTYDLSFSKSSLPVLLACEMSGKEAILFSCTLEEQLLGIPVKRIV